MHSIIRKDAHQLMARTALGLYRQRSGARKIGSGGKVGAGALPIRHVAVSRPGRLWGFNIPTCPRRFGCRGPM
jgi:hypothetical protein